MRTWRQTAEQPTVERLVVAEQLVVWAFRSRLEGPHRRAALRQGFALANERKFARDPLAAFDVLFDLLARCGRGLWFHQRQCCRVSDDEWRILTLIATLQGGDYERSIVAARALVPDQATGPLLWAACGFASDLAEIGLELPLRTTTIDRTGNAIRQSARCH